jgi:methionyl-tRNA formyltransferase
VGELVLVGGFAPLTETSDVSSDESVLRNLKNMPVDFVFVVDFGQFIREPLLSAGKIGCLNIHPSLLPLYRGAAPLQRALMDGASETGVTVFRLERGMDSGPILLTERVLIDSDDDYGSLREKTAVIGTNAFIKLANSAPPESWTFEPQDSSRATSAPKIAREEERIDWGRSAAEIERKIRALSPKPGAWTTIRGKRLIILSARRAKGHCRDMTPGELSFVGEEPAACTGDGFISLAMVQMEGKKPQPAINWQNGLRANAEEYFV